MLACAGLAACVTAPPEAPPAPVAVAAPVAPAPPPPDPGIALAEARALLAQAETDVQRARARRALWLKAWEDLVAARQAVAAGDAPSAIVHARRASELSQLGLEQLAYPAVKASPGRPS
jgi:hypothetical protein